MKVNKKRIGQWSVPIDDAKRDVKVRRELVDIWKGDPGVAGNCMNAQCIIRNQKLFPHKVYLASVVKSRVYIVDKIDRKSGNPVHAVRYILSHEDSADIGRHDVLGTASPATLILHAPRGDYLLGSDRKGTHTRPPASAPKGTPVSRGEHARLLAAVGAMNDIEK